MRPLFALVHSPLVGSATWVAVAELLAAQGERVTVPDLTPALNGGAPYLERQAVAVAQTIGSDRVILVGHSGAGPLLPAFGAGLPNVAGYVFVDAGLPTPGKGWMETAPRALVEQLQSMASAGWLPPWPQWWGDAALAELLPGDEQRRRFTADCPALPLAMFEERRPEIAGWPDARCAYLALSDGYSAELEQARTLGWPTAELPSHHLAMLTAPQAMADSIRALAERIA